MFKKAFLVACAAVAFGFMAKAQTNLQTFYDFGKDRQYITTTFEMFKADKFGDTFFFIDHYFNSFSDKAGNYRTDGQGNRKCSAINGSYFEIERGLNFWQDTKLKDLSAHVEYDGSTWGEGMWCFGAKYFFHSKDYSNMLTLYLMYDLHCGSKADVPLKFTAVWGLNKLFGVERLCFKGFLDVWGLNSVLDDGSTSKFSILTEPQLWFNLGQVFDGHLDIGTEIELSYNFAGKKGFMCNPCAGLRWTF